MNIKKIESPVGAGDSKEKGEQMTNIPYLVYHNSERVSTPRKKQTKTNGVILAFCIGIVVGLIIGIITSAAIDSSIREFNENPRGAVQTMRMEERI